MIQNQEMTAATRTARADQQALNDHDLMTQFESLGGGGAAGAEFAMVQRHFGAEPSGLLCWSMVDPPELITVLQQRFEGVGLPGSTDLYYDRNDLKAEYWARDKRIGLKFPTFIRVEGTNRGEAQGTVCGNLQTQAQKLIADLSAGERIFVYRMASRDLYEGELAVLLDALRGFGDVTLLYVSYADATHPAGTVTLEASGLIRGYVDRFQTGPNGEPGAPVPDVWLDLCRKAHDLWRPPIDARGAVIVAPELVRSADAQPEPEPQPTVRHEAAPEETLPVETAPAIIEARQAIADDALRPVPASRDPIDLPRFEAAEAAGTIEPAAFVPRSEESMRHIEPEQSMEPRQSVPAAPEEPHEMAVEPVAAQQALPEDAAAPAPAPVPVPVTIETSESLEMRTVTEPAPVSAPKMTQPTWIPKPDVSTDSMQHKTVRQEPRKPFWKRLLGL